MSSRSDQNPTVEQAETPSEGGRENRRLVLALSVLALVMTLAAASMAAAVVRKDAALDRLEMRTKEGDLHQAAWNAADNPANRSITFVSADGNDRVDAVVAATGQGFILGGEAKSLGEESTYQLWAVTPGRLLSLGVVPKDLKDYAFVVPEGAGELHLTIEPLPGSAVPVALPIAVAKL